MSRPALLSIPGRPLQPCFVVAETRNYYRITAFQRITTRSRRVAPGGTALAIKHSIRFENPPTPNLDLVESTDAQQ